MRTLFIFVVLFAAHSVIPAVAQAEDVLIMPVVGDVNARTGRGRRMATHVRELVLHGLRAADQQGRLVTTRCERVTCVEAAIAEAEGVETAILVRLFQEDARITEVVVVVVRDSGQHGSARAPVPASTRSNERAVVAAAASFALATALDDEGSVEELVTLRITGSPEGAAVTVDGVAVGVLPLETQVARGTWQVAVAKFGYESQVRPVEVNDERALEVTLRALPETDPLAEPHGASETHGPSETHGSETHGSETHGSSEGSAWPSYVIGGGMVAAGVALWVSPILTLVGSGDVVAVTRPSGPFTVDQVSMDGGQVALAIGGSVLLAAGAVFFLGRWVRTAPEPSTSNQSPSIRPSISASSDGAHLILEGTF